MREGKDVSGGLADTAFERQRRSVWILLFLIWLVLGIFSAGSAFVELPQVRRAAPPPGMEGFLWRMFVWQLAVWMAWVPLAPAALWLRRLFPLERAALWRSFVVHLIALVLLGGVHAGAVLGLMGVIQTSGSISAAPTLLTRLTYWWMRDMPFCVLFYGVILGIGSALDYYRRFRERELRASQLEAQLAQAELQMLRMQLNPHFLFNTLNGITGLVRDHDNPSAVEMLVGLSDLLRQTLDNSGKQEVPLSEELQWLELYLNIQQMRFSDRLRVLVEADPQTLDAMVPNLIAQPLVENALRHGLAHRAEAGSLSLITRRSAGRLELIISDDGAGLPEGWQMENNSGLGLKNTEARLRQIYGADFVFTVNNREPGGVEAFLSIPLRKDSFFGSNGNGRN